MATGGKKSDKKTVARDRYGVRKRSTKNMSAAKKKAYKSRQVKGRDPKAKVRVWDRKTKTYTTMTAGQARRKDKKSNALGTKSEGSRYRVVSKRTYKAGTRKGTSADEVRRPGQVVKRRQTQKARATAAPNRSPNSKTGGRRGSGKPKATETRGTANKGVKRNMNNAARTSTMTRSKGNNAGQKKALKRHRRSV